MIQVMMEPILAATTAPTLEVMLVLTPGITNQLIPEVMVTM